MKFGWLGDLEHRVFNYKPRYYDEKEERSALRSEDDNTGKKEDYAPGTFIQGAFRGGNYSVKRSSNKLVVVISLIGLILFIIVLILITRFFSLL